jgi:hypothetical protein
MGMFKDKLIEEIEIRGYKDFTKKAYLDSMCRISLMGTSLISSLGTGQEAAGNKMVFKISYGPL